MRGCWCFLLVPLVSVVLWLDDDLPEGTRTGDASSIPNSGWVESRKQTPSVKSEPTPLVNFNWAANTSCKVTPEDIANFERDGFVLIKNALSPEGLDIMHEEAARICKGQLATRKVCQIEQLRWQVNSFRDFMFYSELGCYAHHFIRGKGVRIATEALFGTQFNWQNPAFFSYSLHTDTPGNFRGRYHGYPSDVKGVSAWFPFHDLNDETQGGSIVVVQGYGIDNDCHYRACGGMIWPSRGKEPAKYDCSPCKAWRPPLRTFAFKKGDVLFFHPDMPHATQPVKQMTFTRHSFTMRLVDSDAELCSVAMSCGDWMGCCKDVKLEVPQRIHSHCWPQIFPEVLEHEAAAHYSDTPKHLMGDLAWNDYVHTIRPTRECDSVDRPLE